MEQYIQRINNNKEKRGIGGYIHIMIVQGTIPYIKKVKKFELRLQ